MKYIVVSCCEREITLENICGTYTEAYELMKKCFLNYHLESCRCDEKEIEELRLEIETEVDVQTSKYGFSNNSAWSNVNDDYNYDIKIIETNEYMIATGIIRRLDEFGRICVPLNVRKSAFKTEHTLGKPLEIFYKTDGTIILKPYEFKK